MSDRSFAMLLSNTICRAAKRLFCHVLFHHLSLFFCGYFLCFFFFIAGILAWNIQIPSYISSTGFVAGPDQPAVTTSQDQTSIILFIPASSFSLVKTGQTVQIQLPERGQR